MVTQPSEQEVSLSSSGRRFLTASMPDWFVPVIIGVANFMQMMEGSIMVTALPVIARDYHVSPVQMNVTMTTFLLALTVFLPLSGWLADKLGAKRLFLISMLIFALSSAACGFAADLPQMVIGRIFQGMAAAMMTPVGRLLLLRTTPKDQLVKAMAVILIPSLLGPVVGPVLGGALVTFADWRWIFFVNLPVAAVGIALAWWFVPNVKPRDVPRFDWWGILLTALASGSIIFAFNALSHGHPNLLVVLGLCALGLASGALYLQHARRREHAVLNLAVFRIPTFRVAIRGGFLFTTAFGATPFLLAMLLQVGFGRSAFETGLLTFILSAGAMTMRWVAPPILARFGYRPVAIVNGLVCAAWLVVYGLFQPSMPYWLIVGLFAISGFSRSLQFTALSGLTFGDVEQEQMSTASTAQAMSYQLSQGVGVGLAATALQFVSSAKGEPHLGWQTIDLVLVLMGAVSLLSVPSFMRLPKDAGEALINRS